MSDRTRVHRDRLDAANTTIESLTAEVERLDKGWKKSNQRHLVESLRLASKLEQAEAERDTAIKEIQRIELLAAESMKKYLDRVEEAELNLHDMTQTAQRQASVIKNIRADKEQAEAEVERLKDLAYNAKNFLYSDCLEQAEIAIKMWKTESEFMQKRAEKAEASTIEWAGIAGRAQADLEKEVERSEAMQAVVDMVEFMDAEMAPYMLDGGSWVASLFKALKDKETDDE